MKKTLQEMAEIFGKCLPEEFVSEYGEVIDMYDSANITAPRRFWFGRHNVAQLFLEEGALVIDVKKPAFFPKIREAAAKFKKQGYSVKIL